MCVYRYQGSIRSGIWTGHGRVELADGSVYEGSLEGGRRYVPVHRPWLHEQGWCLSTTRFLRVLLWTLQAR